MSDFLFAHPSFLTGLGRVFDLGGVFDDYNTFDTPEQADEQALAEDWARVGEDLREALEAEKAKAGLA